MTESMKSGKQLSRQDLFINIAELMAMRGKCPRAKVGCVITQNHRMISSGYNGPVEEGLSCNEDGCDVLKPCKHIHAEANAIAAAAKMGIVLDGSILYCTHGPCFKCAEMIIQAGIKEVYYKTPYRTDEGTELLLRNKIIVIHDEA